MSAIGRVNPFYALCALLVLSPKVLAGVPVEVISGGSRYESIEAYKAVDLKAKIDSPQEEPQDESSWKTFHLPPQPKISDKTAKQWQSVSYEHGMGSAVSDFKQDWNHPIPSFRVSSDKLEERIRSLVEERQEPVLFVSDDKKLRVLSLQAGQVVPNDPQ